jgi:hypothetical protein
MRSIAALIVLLTAMSISTGPVSAAGGAPAGPTLVEIRAAHHPGFDRITFEFEGRLPEYTAASWTGQVTKDPSDQPVPVQGNAFLSVVMYHVDAHEAEPPFADTYGPASRAFDLPSIAHVVEAGDFEMVVSFGVGVMERTRILRTARLRDPARFVIDVATTFPKASVPVVFLHRGLLEAAALDLQAVERVVPADRQVKSALHRLWAGPTPDERATGLRFRSSGSSGFRDFEVNDRGVARLRLEGGCDGRGRAVTVADQVMATLKGFEHIEWVKILDPSGRTREPWGRTDSIPDCLAS